MNELQPPVREKSEFKTKSEKKNKNVAVCISGKFWLTDFSAKEARSALNLLRADADADMISLNFGDEGSSLNQSDSGCSPMILGQFYQFSTMVLQRSTRSLIICVCPGRRSLTAAALLLGGYLAICEKMSLDLIIDAFGPVSSHFVPLVDANGADPSELTMIDCWAALHRATKLGWLDFSDVPSEDAIDMEEHLHYHCPANGQLHVIVPNKLLALPSPHDIPDGLEWADYTDGRRFSPSYFGGILSDFGVAVALCCGSARVEFPYDPAGLAAHGIATEMIPAGARSGRLLAAGDRLITLARAAPGAIALHGLGGWEEGLLLAAYLIRLHSFPARHALAWVHICHPPASTAAPLLAFLPAAAGSVAAAERGCGCGCRGAGGCVQDGDSGDGVAATN
jgi:hypothetical protein